MEVVSESFLTLEINYSDFFKIKRWYFFNNNNNLFLRSQFSQKTILVYETLLFVTQKPIFLGQGFDY